MDTSGSLWAGSKLADKVVSAFTGALNYHGGAWLRRPKYSPRVCKVGARDLRDS